MMKWTRKPRVLSTVAAVLVCAVGGATWTQADEAWELNLDNALRIALENNLDLIAARKDPEIAEQRIESSRSIFDPVIGASALFSDSTGDETIVDNVAVPPSTSQGTSDSEFLEATASWSQLLNFGGSYDVSFRLADTDAFSTNLEANFGFLQQRTFLNTDESVTLRYDMPLLQGFGKEVNQLDVLLAKSNLEISREDLRANAIDVMKRTEDAYWDLLATREALHVARESLRLAKDLYELNKKKVEVGTLPPIDITQAEAGVAGREEDVIVAEVALENAEDVLRGLLAISRDDPRWMLSITPTDEADFQARDIDVVDALAVALEKRPEIIRARQQLKDAELSERTSRRGKRHSLDLSASFTPTQGDQDFRSEILSPPGIAPTDTSTDSDDEQWSVTLTYGFPLRNRQARANYAVARLNREKSEVSLRSVEQDIRIDVRRAARNVNSGAKRVAAARANTVLQRKTLEAEQKKYENGMSTSFEVLRIQNDLSDAQFAEIRAVLDYMKGLSDLERAKGTLLEARGLALGP